MNATPGGAQAGDVLVMYGHIAITAQVLDATHVRVAEANCLNVDGTMGDGTQDTGVVSNTRTDTLGGWNAWILGWYRKN
jgi:surface antigen